VDDDHGHRSSRPALKSDGPDADECCMTELFLVNTFPASGTDTNSVDMLWTPDERKADETVSRLLALPGDEDGPRYISEADHRNAQPVPRRCWVVRKLRLALETAAPSDLHWT
jgi:hypothetical protein